MTCPMLLPKARSRCMQTTPPLTALATISILSPSVWTYMWSQGNRLSIHNGKSEAMLLSTKPLIGPLQELRYEENRIDFVNSTCCLGIEIDNKLSWSPHIDKLCKSYRKKLGALRRMPRLPPKELEEIYFKTVVSGVSYRPYSKMAANKLFFCLHVN